MEKDEKEQEPSLLKIADVTYGTKELTECMLSVIRMYQTEDGGGEE
ncbi:hypothetical protein C817_02504 [Dorea sp. 5-2]|jgi:hypothetical protein|nr:hypothetical protein C817_02504 [Dorea sp. 5-2]MCI9023790.1 hypothetical protein [Dorea sp.]